MKQPLDAADLALAAFVLRTRFPGKTWERLSLVSTSDEIRKAISEVRKAKADMPSTHEKIGNLLRLMAGGKPKPVVHLAMRGD